LFSVGSESSEQSVQGLHGWESGEALPGADEASRAQSSGTIGGHKVAGNRIAATVGH